MFSHHDSYRPSWSYGDGILKLKDNYNLGLILIILATSYKSDRARNKGSDDQTGCK